MIFKRGTSVFYTVKYIATHCWPVPAGIFPLISLEKVGVGGSVADSDGSVFILVGWFRIRIGNTDPDPGEPRHGQQPQPRQHSRGQRVTHTLIKKKIKFSSYIRKFTGVEQLLSHICMRKGFLMYYDAQIFPHI
jgi:hypothetical protein